MKRLEQRIAIITGAGQGIGRAIALGLAREGATVVIAEINEASAKTVKNEIEASGGRALVIGTDVSNETSVQAMVEKSLKEFRRVDILVNNAGIFPTSPVEKMGEEEWDLVIGTNSNGPGCRPQ
jgi:NAD(P)-dependent dehydrogenase (short-subunit alcohol dehydrogenase family)